MSIEVMPWDDYGPEYYSKPANGRGVPLAMQQANVRDLGARDGWNCKYCGIAVEVKQGWRDDPAKPAATVDHIVPRVRGGGDTNFNAVLACGSCNSQKGKRHPLVMAR